MCSSSVPADAVHAPVRFAEGVVRVRRLPVQARGLRDERHARREHGDRVLEQQHGLVERAESHLQAAEPDLRMRALQTHTQVLRVGRRHVRIEPDAKIDGQVLRELV